MADYEVSLDMSLNMVVRDARDAAHAREIAAALARRMAEANEYLSGDDYGQPLVGAFSLHELGEEISVEPLEDGEA